MIHAFQRLACPKEWSMLMPLDLNSSKQRLWYRPLSVTTWRNRRSRHSESPRWTKSAARSRPNSRCAFDCAVQRRVFIKACCCACTLATRTTLEHQTRVPLCSVGSTALSVQVLQFNLQGFEGEAPQRHIDVNPFPPLGRDSGDEVEPQHDTPRQESADAGPGDDGNDTLPAQGGTGEDDEGKATGEGGDGTVAQHARPEQHSADTRNGARTPLPSPAADTSGTQAPAWATHALFLAELNHDSWNTVVKEGLGKTEIPKTMCYKLLVLPCACCCCYNPEFHLHIRLKARVTKCPNSPFIVAAVRNQLHTHHSPKLAVVSCA